MSSASSIAGELRSQSWVGSAPVGGSDACASIPGFFGFVMQYVQPLPQWFDELLGNPAAVSGFAAGWDDVQRATQSLTTDLELSLSKVTELDGRAMRKLRERYSDLAPVVLDTSEWSGAAASALRLASSIVTAVRQFICDFLVSLARFGDELFSFNLNPISKMKDIQRFAAAAWDLIESGQRLIEAMFDALGRLGELLTALGPLVQEALAKIKEIIAGIIAMVPILGGAISDVLEADPDVEELDPGTLSESRQSAYDELMGIGQITSPTDLLNQNGLIDRVSGGDSTSISVQTVVRPDGSEYTLVTLPSTLDWGFTHGGDAGAMNDWDSNVALMMSPGMQTQYERAVLDAMRDAGVSPGADVVWSGFSQGGIMAANLGSDSPYNTIGIINNGSPVNSSIKPPNVPMLSVEHERDLVPKIDDIVFGRGNTVPELLNSTNHDKLVLPPSGDAGFLGHDAQNYRDTLQEYIDNGGTFSNDWSFLNGTVTNTYIGEAVDQQSTQPPIR